SLDSSRFAYASWSPTARSTSKATRRAGSTFGIEVLDQRLGCARPPSLGEHLDQLLAGDLAQAPQLHQVCVLAVEVVDREERAVSFDEGQLVVGVGGPDHQEVVVGLPGL